LSLYIVYSLHEAFKYPWLIIATQRTLVNVFIMVIISYKVQTKYRTRQTRANMYQDVNNVKGNIQYKVLDMFHIKTIFCCLKVILFLKKHTHFLFIDIVLQTGILLKYYALYYALKYLHFHVIVLMILTRVFDFVLIRVSILCQYRDSVTPEVRHALNIKRYAKLP